MLYTFPNKQCLGQPFISLKGPASINITLAFSCCGCAFACFTIQPASHMYRSTPWEMQHHPFMLLSVWLWCSSTGAAGGFVPGSRTARWWMNEESVSFAPARYFQTYCALELNSPWQQNCCFYLLYCTSITRTLHCLGLIIWPDSVGLLAQNMINCSLLIDSLFYTPSHCCTAHVLELYFVISLLRSLEFRILACLPWQHLISHWQSCYKLIETKKLCCTLRYKLFMYLFIFGKMSFCHNFCQNQ